MGYSPVPNERGGYDLVNTGGKAPEARQPVVEWFMGLGTALAVSGTAAFAAAELVIRPAMQAFVETAPFANLLTRGVEIGVPLLVLGAVSAWARGREQRNATQRHEQGHR